MDPCKHVEYLAHSTLSQNDNQTGPDRIALSLIVSLISVRLQTRHIRRVLFMRTGCVSLVSSNRCRSWGEEVRFQRLPEAMQEAGIAFTEHGTLG